MSLPSDLLEARIAADKIVGPEVWRAAAASLPAGAAAAVCAAIAAAARPIVLAGPQLSGVSGRALLARLETALQAPCVIVESPRGLADATLGGFADLIRACDLIVLLGKALDFTVKWTSGPAFDPDVQVIAIDPDPALVERARTEKGRHFVSGWVADAHAAAAALIAAVGPATRRSEGWLKEARAALDDRPSAWATLAAQAPGRLHPAEVFRCLRPYIERDPETVLICDGGEFAQWAQSMLPVRRRLINGVAGAIGASLPMALAARIAEPQAPVIAVLGDGTVGFHLAEFETALRRRLPFVAIVGNDARWNAESQIQRREYGAQRMHGCDLLPARYDQVVAALGGQGEFVQRAADLPGALDRALASGKPACLNVSLEGAAAPVIKRESSAN